MHWLLHLVIVLVVGRGPLLENVPDEMFGDTCRALRPPRGCTAPTWLHPAARLHPPARIVSRSRIMPGCTVRRFLLSGLFLKATF